MPLQSRVDVELYDNIFQFCDIRTIQAMRASSPALDRVGARFLDSAYNAALKRFVVDHVAFRSLLRLVGAVISGSFALHFLDRDRSHLWTPRDLDVYAPAHYGRRIVHYLIHVERYTVLRQQERHYPFAFGVFKTVVTLTRGDHKIDVIVSSSASALFPVSEFWGTHVINYLTADDFCVAYPGLTLQGRSLIHQSALVGLCPRPYTRDLMAKYEERGFAFRIRYMASARSADMSLECDRGEGCPRRLRHFGDRFCLMGSFHDTSVGRLWPGGMEDGLTVAWWRGGDACGGRCEYGEDFMPKYIPHSRTVLADPLLRHGEYLLP